jgi:fibro-slime domain-containing protein
MVSRPLLLPLLILGCAAHFSFAQLTTLPDTLWIPVIYYDFHSSKTPKDNPDFQFDNWNEKTMTGVKPGMIQDTLDKDKKPVFRQNRTFNTNIAKWYRPSNAPGAQFILNPTNNRREWTNLKNYKIDRPNEWVGLDFVQGTDPLENVVIYDSLPFLLDNSPTAVPGTYNFVDSTFFPLDNRGFGNEYAPGGSGPSHNFSFAMELHTSFLHKPGLEFKFIGDDDVFAFIHNNLEMDLGGIHGPAAGSIILDTLGLQVGTRYSFDFFYAERKTNQSTISITTNLLTPQQLVLRPLGNDTTTAGVRENVLQAIVVDSLGNETEHEPQSITWEILNPLPGDELLRNQGDTLSVYTERAHRAMTVRVTYINPKTKDTLTTTTTVWVKPAAASIIDIESVNDDGSNVNLNTAQPIDTLFIAFAQQQILAHAIVRDRFGNFVQLGNGVSWGTAPDSYLQATGRSGAAWIGELNRGPLPPVNASQSVIVTAAQSGLTSGTTVVMLESEIKVKPVIATPSAPNDGLYEYHDSVVVTLSTPTPNATITYSINGGEWQQYNQPITLYSLTIETITAKASINQVGYVDSETRSWRYKRIAKGPLAPLATPAGGEYRGSVAVTLQSGNSSVTNPIYYYLAGSAQSPPEIGDMGRWQLYGATLTLNDSTPQRLYAYATNDEGTSTVSQWLFTNLDWRGPQIQQARLYLGNPPGSAAQSKPDTLLINFNEPVSSGQLVNLATVLNFLDGVGSLSSAQLFGGAYISPPPAGSVSEITIILPLAGAVQPRLDRIQVVVNGLNDIYGNPTRPHEPTTIQWGRDYAIVTSVSPNPALHGSPETAVPADIITHLVQTPNAPSIPRFATMLKAIAVDSINPNVQLTKLAIYDAVGNVVQDRLPPYLFEDGSTAMFFWDHTNRSGRLVGSATYVGIVTITLVDGTTHTEKQKIAVRR